MPVKFYFCCFFVAFRAIIVLGRFQCLSRFLFNFNTNNKIKFNLIFISCCFFFCLKHAQSIHEVCFPFVIKFQSKRKEQKLINLMNDDDDDDDEEKFNVQINQPQYGVHCCDSKTRRRFAQFANSK